MNKLVWLMASAAWALAGTSAQAQEQSGEPAAAPAEREAQQGILVYEPAFFADSNPTTALDMVSRIPGFRVNDGASVRGYAGAGGNILINGARPASKDDSGSSVLGRTSASRVERIELIRGGAPGIDMQGMTVVVNVILATESSRQHTMMGQLSIFEGGPVLPSARYDFSANEDGREWNFQFGRTIAMSDSTGHGRLVRRGPDGSVEAEEEVRSKFDGGGWNSRGEWSGPIGEGRIVLSGGLNWYEFGERLLYIADDGAVRRFDFHDDNSRADFGLRYERPLSETLNLETRLIQNLRRSEIYSTAASPGGSQRFDADRESGETIVRGVLRWERNEQMTIESGGELAFNFLDTTQAFTVNGTDIPLPLATTRVEELRGEVFGQAAWRLSDRLSVEAGARLEHSTITQSGDASAERSFFYAKPRLTATWTPVENHQIRLRLERELGQLNFNDFAASASLSNNQVHGGNLDLRPQQRWIAEAVYERRFWEEGVLTLTLRHDEILDVIDVIPLDGGLTAIGNIGDGTLDRAAANLRLPLERFGVERGRLTFNVQYDHTRVTDPTTGESRAISRIRPLTGLIQFANDVPAWDLTWGIDYTPYFRETTFNPDQERVFELRNYTTVYAEYTIREGLTLRAAMTVWDDFRLDRAAYSDRDTQAIAYTETQRINPRDFLQLRLRAVF